MLNGRIALVTGATRNTGLGIAEVLSRYGAAVFVNGEDQAEVDRAVRDLRDRTGGRFHGAPADVSDELQVRGMFAEVAETAGRLDILVNNACHLGVGPGFLDTTAEFFDRVMAVNARGYFLCAREAARLMTARGTGGAIVNIGSITARNTIRGRLAYVASKGAIESMTRAMALELAESGIRVNCILPGYIHSDRWDELSEEDKSLRRGNIPLGREAFPEDIAEAAAFLVSDRASNITGAFLPITGGKDVQMVPRDRER